MPAAVDLVELDGSAKLGGGGSIHPSHWHDAAVEDQPLVAGLEQDLVDPNPDRRFVVTVVFRDANPGVLPTRGRFLNVTRAGNGAAA